MNYAKTISITVTRADVIGACAVIAILGVTIWAMVGKRKGVDLRKLDEEFRERVYGGPPAKPMWRFASQDFGYQPVMRNSTNSEPPPRYP